MRLGKACIRHNFEMNLIDENVHTSLLPSCSYDEAVPAVGRLTQADPCHFGQPVSRHELVLSIVVETEHWPVCSGSKFPYLLLVVAEDLDHQDVAQQEVTLVS